MPNSKAIGIGVVLAVLASLTACESACPGTRIGLAANETNDPVVAGSRRQLYQWRASPRIDALLRETLESKGVAALTREHGMQCVRRPPPEDCPDCYSCTATFPAQRMDIVGIGMMACRADGTMYVRADIGTQDIVTSMTFWDSQWLKPGRQSTE